MQLSNKAIINVQFTFSHIFNFPFTHDTSFYEYLELVSNFSGFVAERKKVEHYSLHADLDEVYEKMDSKFMNLKELEVSEVKRLLQPDPLVLKLYSDAIQEGKNITVVSETYSEDIVLELFEKF